MSGYSDEAANALRNATTLMDPTPLMGFVDQLDQVQQYLMLAGQRFQDLFGHNIARIQQALREEVPTLRNIASDMSNAAARLQGNG